MKFRHFFFRSAAIYCVPITPSQRPWQAADGSEQQLVGATSTQLELGSPGLNKRWLVTASVLGFRTHCQGMRTSGRPHVDSHDAKCEF